MTPAQGKIVARLRKWAGPTGQNCRLAQQSSHGANSAQHTLIGLPRGQSGPDCLAYLLVKAGMHRSDCATDGSIAPPQHGRIGGRCVASRGERRDQDPEPVEFRLPSPPVQGLRRPHGSGDAAFAQRQRASLLPRSTRAPTFTQDRPQKQRPQGTFRAHGSQKFRWPAKTLKGRFRCPRHLHRIVAGQRRGHATTPQVAGLRQLPPRRQPPVLLPNVALSCRGAEGVSVKDGTEGRSAAGTRRAPSFSSVRTFRTGSRVGLPRRWRSRRGTRGWRTCSCRRW